MSTAEIEKRIDECIQELSRFKAFSPEARAAIENLERLKGQVKSLSKQMAQELMKMIDEQLKRSSAYASFIPKTIENLKFIRSWLEKKLPELK
jgi:archaellum component FlaC